MSLISDCARDIIFASAAVKDFIVTLSNARNSPSEYQTTVRELQNLEAVLGDLQDLAALCEHTGNYDTLAQRARIEALKCRALITPFQNKIARYRESLRVGGSNSRARDAYWKLHWHISHRDDLEEFRRAVWAQTQVMIIIMGTSKIKSDILTDDALDRQLKAITSLGEQVISTHRSFKVDTDAKFEELCLRLERLEQATTQTSGFFLQINEKLWLICNIASWTWRAVLFIQNQLPRMLSLWPQQPAILDDLFGKKVPVPLELVDNWRVLFWLVGIQVKQRSMNNMMCILHDADSGEEISPAHDDVKIGLRPGRRIVMTALFTTYYFKRSCYNCRVEDSGAINEEIQCPCGFRYLRVGTPRIPEEPCLVPLQVSTRRGYQYSQHMNFFFVDFFWVAFYHNLLAKPDLLRKPVSI